MKTVEVNQTDSMRIVSLLRARKPGFFKKPGFLNLDACKFIKKSPIALFKTTSHRL